MTGRSVGILLLAGVLLAVGAVAQGPAAATVHRAAGVTVRLESTERPVPASFLGLSLEWTELPVYAANWDAFGRVLARLSVAGQRIPFRLGGETADSTWWRTERRLPPKAYGVDAAYFAWLGMLAREHALSVLLDLNLAARSPAMATMIARQTRQWLPRASVSGFEIGNEPDLYVLGLLGELNIARNPDAPFQWVFGYGPAAYAADFARYVDAVRRVWPHVRYAGPAEASTRRDLVRRTIATGRLSMLTVHRYEFNACPGPASRTYPSQRRYLSVAASRAFAAKNRWPASVTRRLGLPLKVTEFGSAVCGVPGVTNTFATALWAAETIFDLLAQGVDGVYVHMRPARANTAVSASRESGLGINPLFYGMLLVTRTLGPGASLMRVQMSDAPANFSVWAVRDRTGTVRVLMLNESPTAVAAKLVLGGQRAGTVERLTAPSPAATGGLRFGGRSLTPAGRWSGRERLEPVSGPGGVLDVAVPRFSAALLTVAP